jgi:hypothetical protein
MSNSIVPSQIGYTAIGSQSGSQIIFGKDFSVSFEAIGLGGNLRPDPLEAFRINISALSGYKGASSDKKIASFSISKQDIYSLYTGNVNFPSSPEFKLREFSVCVYNEDTQDSEEKRVALFASDVYATGNGNAARLF